MAASIFLPLAQAAAVEPLMFYLFGGLALASALGVVLSGNIVRSAMFLFGTLSGVAGLYFLMYANLLAAIQLIVYAGGTLILIIFGIMLTSKSPWMKYAPKRREILIGILVAGGLFAALAKVVLSVDWSAGAKSMSRPDTVRSIGEALLQPYLVPFEVASVLLLVVLIAAAYLAKPEK